jgi:nitrite reductase/ring-hydroxylating ferredoxin subunit
MQAQLKRVIVANITWNKDGWRNLYLNPKAGHKFAREHVGHESLNFDFNKPIDTKEKIHGYVQWTKTPAHLADNSVIIFYTKNLITNKGEIVGVYCGSRVLTSPIEFPYKGFENDKLISNIEADPKTSFLFPIPLNADKYKQSNKKRLVPQSGFTYKDLLFAKTIIVDEISILKRSGGLRKDEYQKLKNIYKFITSEEYDDSMNTDDNLEQEEIIKLDKEVSKQDIIQDLRNVVPSLSEQVEYKGKRYKRDNKTIADLKIIRDFKCQICGVYILKKDGSYYIEAAHIIAKSSKGVETPDNILILCPNHHKEFDYGDKEIIHSDKEKVKFRMNGKLYSISLKI